MAKEIGQLNVKIGLDSTGFQNGISGINREMCKVQSEFRLASAEMGKHGKELDSLKLRSDSLTKQTELQRQKVQALEAAHQKSVETKGKDAKATQDLEIKLNRAKTQLVRMEQDLKDINREIEIQSSGWYKLSQRLEPIGRSLQDVGKRMTDIGKNLSMKVTAPLVGLGAVVAKTGMDFEAAMSEVGAISGAAGSDLAALENIAKEMGATTKFSASEAAEGLKYMAMAGWDTQQMLDGLPGVLSLAAASGEDLGTVSDIVTDAMTAFGMEAVRAGEFADTLAAAASSSNTNVSMLGESFKYVAPVAGSLGYAAKDTAIALGLMANAGIKGSQAGTAMRTILTRLVKPTKESGMAMDQLGISLTDTDGNMKSLAEVMDDLRKAFQDLDPEQQAFYAAQIAGQQGMSGLLAIVNTSEEEYNKLARAINNSTSAAERMSKEMQDNLQGRLTELKSAIEGAALQLYDAMLPALEKIVAMVQKAVGWFADLNPEIKTAIVVIAGLAAAIGPLLLVFGPLISTLGTLITGLGAMSAAMAGGATVVAGLSAGFPALGAVVTIATGPIGLAVAAIAGLTAGGIALYRHLKSDAIPAVNLFGDEISEATQQAVGSFLELNDEATLALNQLSWSGQEVSKEMAGNIAGNFTQMAKQIQAGLDEHHQESLAKMQSFLNSSSALSKKEQDEILNNMQEGYENRSQAIADGEARIKEILDTASAKKRALTREEQEEINTIQQEMVDTGIKVLSENEIEAKAIMERLKEHAGEMSALQAAEVVENSLKQKEGAIQAAEEQYDEVLKEIIRQRDEAGAISEEQAEKLIAEAARQKDEAIAKAEEMHQKVVEEAKAQAKEHVNQVDWETGEIKSKWQVMKADIADKVRSIKEDVKNRWEEIKKDSAEKWENIRTDISDRWNEIKTNTAETAATIKTNVSTTWDEVKAKTFETWENLKSKTSESWQAMQSKIDEHGGGIKGLIGAYTEEYKTVWDSALSTMERVTGIKFSEMADKVTGALDRIKKAISSAIDRIKEWNATSVKEKVFSIKERITRVISTITGGGEGGAYSGTSFFPGGLVMVGELGPELVALPRGSRVYNDHETKKILGGSKGITQHITINSPTPLTPAETARRIKNASRQLALEW